LNVHYHVAIPDEIACDVAIRTLAWLRRRELLRDEPDERDSTEQRDRSALRVCLEGSLGLGELTALLERDEAESDYANSLPVPSKSARRGGTDRGFDLHAGVVVSAADREGSERLLRYCARPPLSLERLRSLPDGRVAYALRKPWGKQTHRVMTPLQFLARLVALVPPPRHPLIRFHGVFAPRSCLRARVIPRSSSGSPSAASCSESGKTTGRSARAPARVRGAATEGQSAPSAAAVAQAPLSSVALAAAAVEAKELVSAPDPRVRAFPDALGLGLGSRIPWAELLKRVYNVDALDCSCGGRLRFIALILESDVARRILDRPGSGERATTDRPCAFARLR
jgi:hypothetical protein